MILFCVIFFGFFFCLYQWLFDLCPLYYKTYKQTFSYIILLGYSAFVSYAIIYSYLKACFTNPGYLSNHDLPTDINLCGINPDEPFNDLQDEESNLKELKPITNTNIADSLIEDENIVTMRHTDYQLIDPFALQMKEVYKHNTLHSTKEEKDKELNRIKI